MGFDVVIFDANHIQTAQRSFVFAHPFHLIEGFYFIEVSTTVDDFGHAIND